MTWLKRNLFLVIGGAVAVALLCGAGFILWSQKQRADGVTVELDGLITEYQTLTGRDPFPNQENIDATKMSRRASPVCWRTAGGTLSPPPPTPTIDSATFKEILENTIAELEKEAERSA